jgi:antitoxin component YwqK of YwqJK toxin-antitoxin module
MNAGDWRYYCRESHVNITLSSNLLKMRWISFLILLFSLSGFAQERYQWKEYKLTPRGDTIDRVDHLGRKQGPWVHRLETVRGEPGYEEEGWYENDRKEGAWRLYALSGDLVGTENYKWGLKDGICRYFTKHGELKLEQSWKALNPDKLYDTIQVEDIDKLDTYKEVIVKNEGAALKHGIWKYYGEDGIVLRSELYTLGKLEEEAKTTVANAEKKPVAKPKEVLEFEKKNSGKKKVRYRDGSTGGGF